MKKLLVILVAVCGMAVSASASAYFRWTGCSKNGQRIELYKDGSVLYTTPRGSYRGTYRWSNYGNGSGTISILIPSLDDKVNGDVYNAGDVGNSPERVYMDINGIRFSRGLCN